MKQTQIKCTALVSEVLRKTKHPLSMSEIVERVTALQARKKTPKPFGRRDIYNAVHNNAKSEASLFVTSGTAVRGQHGAANSMVYTLRTA